MRIDLGADNRIVFQDRLDVPKVGRNLRLSGVPQEMATYRYAREPALAKRSITSDNRDSVGEGS